VSAEDRATRQPASFRDPSGFLFFRDGVLLRQVEASYAVHLRALHDSGLYDALVGSGALVAHEEVALELAARPGALAVLRPEVLPFVSYPYEWCFGQLRAAALHTLRVQRQALAHGMCLKDASAFNVAFVGARPIFIDTLSFEVYDEGRPWVGYRQFCQHFLAPLALAAHRDLRLLQSLRTSLDGFPLDLASGLLPWRTRLSPHLYAHIHLHARMQARHADDARSDGGARARRATVSRRGLEGLLDSLESAVKALRPASPKTEWGDYYRETNYVEAAFEAKRERVVQVLEARSPGLVFDFGANTGEFARLASERGAFTLAFDVDPVAVERAFADASARRDERLLPLRMDLTNPSPALGWAHHERASLVERGPADLGLALALVHHLAIGNNVPLDDLANAFAELVQTLLIEFVPKHDSQVVRLLATRADVFPDYDRDHFEAAFARRFVLRESWSIPGSERRLYLMEQRAPSD